MLANRVVHSNSCPIPVLFPTLVAVRWQNVDRAGTVVGLADPMERPVGVLAGLSADTASGWTRFLAPLQFALASAFLRCLADVAGTVG